MNNLQLEEQASTVPAITLVIPAAGVGKRMKAHCPKQYLTINGKTILEHTVQLFLNYSPVAHIIIAVNDNDEYFSDCALLNHPKISVVQGGKERADSVLSGVMAAKTQWIMVHDGVRPCVYHQDLDALIEAAMNHTDGAILASPVVNTLKRANAQNNITETVDRDQLWSALTPQMFEREKLLNALQLALEQKLNVTDEASAIELLGGHPKLVHGRADNIKITQPEDLALAAFFISQRDATQNDMQHA